MLTTSKYSSEPGNPQEAPRRPKPCPWHCKHLHGGTPLLLPEHIRCRSANPRRLGLAKPQYAQH